MKIAAIGVLAFCVALSVALSPGDLAWGQTGAGPVGHPQGGGQLPQDEDTLATIVPSTTQTQAGAIAGGLCNTTICYVPVANSGDVVALRQCTLAPMRTTIINNSGNPITIFGSGTDTINGIATATGISLPAATSTLKVGTAEFTSAVGGTAAKWFSH
jgi:hypothetical protein